MQCLHSGRFRHHQAGWIIFIRVPQSYENGHQAVILREMVFFAIVCCCAVVFMVCLR